MAASLRERFNSGKVGAMMTLYEPEAVLIAKDGRTVTDPPRSLPYWSVIPASACRWRPRREMCSLPAISPRSCWTGQLMAQVPTASTCTSEARQAMSCAAALMDSGGT